MYCDLKSIADHQQSVKFKSPSIKTLWPVCTETFYKDRQTDRGIFYWPNHSGGNSDPNKKIVETREPLLKG